ncbi:MAG: LysR family transcriptional regulator, partial [Erythrobacter sp.]
MSLQQLRTFVEVYRRRSLSDAARALGITQPAASQHIASLETQLG